MKLRIDLDGKTLAALEIGAAGVSIHLSDLRRPAESPATPPETAPDAMPTPEPPSESSARPRAVYGPRGEVKTDPDAQECPGTVCRDRGAVGFYFPKLGEKRCGICETRST